MPDTTNPGSIGERPTRGHAPAQGAPTAAQLAVAAEQSEREAREFRKQQKEQERRDAAEVAKKAEVQRQADQAAAVLNRKRDEVWAASLPKSLGGFAGMAATVQASIAQYRASMDVLSLPRWEQDAVISGHPIMGVMPWLALFVVTKEGR